MKPIDRDANVLRQWRWLIRLARALALANLLVALVLLGWGGQIDPRFANPGIGHLFLVGSGSLAAQAWMMAYLYRRLVRNLATPGAAPVAARRLRWLVTHRALRRRHACRHRRVANHDASDPALAYLLPMPPHRRHPLV